MFALTFLGDVAVFAAGFALCWFGKDKVQALVIDANTLSAKWHAKADALVAKANQ